MITSLTQTTSPATQSLPYQSQHIQENWTSDRPWTDTGLIQSPQSQSPNTRHSPPGPGQLTSKDDPETRERREKRREQNRRAQQAFRERKRIRMLEEMEKKNGLRTKTEPQEGKGINAGSMKSSVLLQHGPTDGSRQNKRPHMWDSEHKVDVKEPRLTRSMTERRRHRSDFDEGETGNSTMWRIYN